MFILRMIFESVFGIVGFTLCIISPFVADDDATFATLEAISIIFVGIAMIM